MLDNVAVVLFKPKFPENVGSAARACANMGCPNLILVRPMMWDMDKALPMATVKGREVLNKIAIVDDLPTALAPFSRTYGTTARTGGWRKGVATPAKAATGMVEELRQGGSVALVFGPEDRGLTNEETEICTQLITIPTAVEASSLNLSQAVLLVLYECFKSALERPFTPSGPPPSSPTTHEEQEVLFSAMREALLAIDYLKADNPDYWMMPVRRFMQRVSIRRNEFNLLMGICRQIKWVAGLAGKK